MQLRSWDLGGLKDVKKKKTGIAVTRMGVNHWASTITAADSDERDISCVRLCLKTPILMFVRVAMLPFEKQPGATGQPESKKIEQQIEEARLTSLAN